MMKFLALTSYLLARITLTLMSSFAILVVFKKSILRCNYINLELLSASLCALCELLEKYAILCGNNRSSRPEVFC